MGLLSELRSDTSRNVLSNWLANAVRLAVGLVISPFLVHSLGNAQYGIWTLVFQLTGYMGILDLGIRSAVVRFVSKYKTLEDHRRVNAVVNTSLAVFCGVGLLVIAVAAAVSPWMDRFFQIEPGLESRARILVIIIGFNVALSFPFGVIGAVLGGGLQRFDISNAIQIVVLLVRTAVIVLVVRAGYGITAMGLIMLGESILGYSARYLAIRRHYPQFRINLRLADRSALRVIFSYSVYSFLMAVAVQLIYRSSSVIIGATLSVAAVTLFWIPGGLIENVRQLVQLLTMVLIPRVSELEAKHDTEGIYHILVRGTRFVMLISLPAGLIFLGRGREFIELWMGKGYAHTAVILYILTIPQFIALPQRISSAVLFGVGKHKWLCVVAVFEAVAAVLLSILLIRPYGLPGVAVGISVPTLLTNSLFHPVYTCRVIRFPVRRYLWKGLLQPAVATLPAVLYLLARPSLANLSWPLFVAEASLIGVLFLVPAWWFVLWPELRTSCLGTLRSAWELLTRPSSMEQAP